MIPKSVSQHIEEEFKRSPRFRKAYSEEIAKLRIAYKIAQLRKARHLSQAELAKKMNTTQQTVSRLEDPKNYRISVRTLATVAGALRARLNIDLILR